MTIINNNKPEVSMIANISAVLSNIGVASIAMITSVWGQVIALILFIGAYFASIAGLVHIIRALVVIDGLLGVTVSVKSFGSNSILSSRLRQSLYKMFFYLLFIIFTFLIEQQIVADSYITSKIIFAVMSGVELWSIAANALILLPKFPFLRLFKKYLSSEIGKKLSLTSQEVEDLLNEQKTDDKEV